MTPTQVEAVYDALAAGIDAAGPGKAELFLAKLALLMARDLGDPARVQTLIDDAGRNLRV
jgi:hypothetical protein